MAMTFDEAKRLLLLHSNDDPDFDHPKWEGGFLGSLRPYRGALDESNFHEVMACLRAVAPGLGRGNRTDRELVSALWGICHLSRAWGIYADGDLRRNGLISDEQVQVLNRWVECISYTTMMLLDTQNAGEAFEGYRQLHGEQPDYATAILESALPEKGELAAWARRAVALHVDEPREPLPPGASRIGGSPDVPPGFAWPRGTFVAQLNLAVLHFAGIDLLPSDGSLLFFGDSAGECPVFHLDTNPGEPLARVEPPSEHAHSPLAVHFEPCMTYPDVSHPAQRGLNGAVGAALRDVLAKAEQYGHPWRLGEPRHQILGHPKRHMAGVADAAGDWELLLQLEIGDGPMSSIWPDGERVSWIIRRSDLRSARWDRTRCVVSSALATGLDST